MVGTAALQSLQLYSYYEGPLDNRPSKIRVGEGSSSPYCESAIERGASEEAGQPPASHQSALAKRLARCSAEVDNTSVRRLNLAGLCFAFPDSWNHSILGNAPLLEGELAGPLAVISLFPLAVHDSAFRSIRQEHADPFRHTFKLVSLDDGMRVEL